MTDETLAFPASPVQERLWFLATFDPASAAYNNAVRIDLDGAIDAARLRRALSALAQRHEILRTHLAADAEGLVQVVSERATLPLLTVNLEMLDTDEREQELSDQLVTHAARPFDLASGPLVRAVLFRLRETSHVLLLTLHHVISDGWTFDLLLHELGVLYDRDDGGASLAPPELQYADVAIWQRDELETGELAQQVRWWEQTLAGVPYLELETDFPRPSVQTHQGAVARATLNGVALEELRQKARELGATTYHLVAAALFITLHGTSGQRDFAVGTPVAARDRPELHDVAGCVMNLVTLRADLDDDPTLEALVARVKRRCIEAFAHPDAPFDRVVEALKPPRDAGKSPIFPVVLNYHAGHPTAPSFDGASATVCTVHLGSAQTDLTLDITDTAESLELTLEYATALFSASTAERMLARFVHVLGEFTRSTSRRLSALELLPESERNLVLDAFNATALPTAGASWFLAPFERLALEHPDRRAVFDDTHSLTYGELAFRARQLAAELRERGAGRDRLIGVCVPRGVTLAVALVATLMAGAAYVPIDPTYPNAAIEHMVVDSGAVLVLTDRDSAAKLPANAPVLVLDGADSRWRDREGTALSVDRRPSDLAYVIYTSGSTGKPKGVMIEHAAVENFLESMAREPGLSADDLTLSVTSPSFDIFGLELYLPLVLGASTCLVDKDTARDGAALMARAAAVGATLIQATPTSWRLVLAAGARAPACVRRLLTGGEPLTADLASALLSWGPELWNVYGPTETTVWSTAKRITDASAITVGRPIGNTVCRVLGERGALLPIGVPGELWIGGKGVARGYLGRPELTAERFVSDRWAPEGERLYRTGDRARWNSDGELLVMGRLDNQIKLRGFRIELGEVEAALLQLDGVAGAAVAVHDDQLIAYVVPAPGRELAFSEMRAKLKNELPEQLLPSALVELTELPRTPNGKLDRKALPAPRGTLWPPSSGELVGTQKRLAAIWSELLPGQPIEQSSDFFELGGNSLSLIQLLTRIREQFGVEITVRQAFTATRLEELARLIDVPSVRWVPVSNAESLPPPPPVPMSRRSSSLSDGAPRSTGVRGSEPPRRA